MQENQLASGLSENAIKVYKLAKEQQAQQARVDLYVLEGGRVYPYDFPYIIKYTLLQETAGHYIVQDDGEEKILYKKGYKNVFFYDLDKAKAAHKERVLAIKIEMEYNLAKLNSDALREIPVLDYLEPW